MHPDEEKRFVTMVLDEPGVVLVHGGNWPSRAPPLVRSLDDIDDYAPISIWCPEETPPPQVRYIESAHGNFWDGNVAAIQFLRSYIHDDAVLTEGRIAVATHWGSEATCDDESARCLERRYKRLRKWFRANYANSVVAWHAPDSPRSPTNPGKPDPQVWVGEIALRWLRAPNHSFKQCHTYKTEAILCE
jgi:hypothetical protein